MFVVDGAGLLGGAVDGVECVVVGVEDLGEGFSCPVGAGDVVDVSGEPARVVGCAAVAWPGQALLGGNVVRPCAEGAEELVGAVAGAFVEGEWGFAVGGDAGQRLVGECDLAGDGVLELVVDPVGDLVETVDEKADARASRWSVTAWVLSCGSEDVFEFLAGEVAHVGVGFLVVPEEFGLAGVGVPAAAVTVDAGVGHVHGFLLGVWVVGLGDHGSRCAPSWVVAVAVPDPGAEVCDGVVGGLSAVVQ
ncbi:hypothetical protein GS909_19910 [Rhodococcus hoagii]|nr:hypothetical protein [Prescottella equi]